MSETGIDQSSDDREVAAQFREYRASRDVALRNDLIESHVRLADFCARRFVYRGEPFDDLRQVALVGLLKAVERFDPDRGVRFTSFATPTIVGELKRHFRDRGWAVRVPRRLQELHLQIGRLVGSLSQELGRPPTTAELAERASVSEEEVLESMEAATLYRLSSLDVTRVDDDGLEVAVGSRLGAEDPEFGSVESRVEVLELLRQLPEREQKIVYLRFFEGLTQAEIADRIGLSQMHVSRLLTRSLDALAAHAGRLPSLDNQDDEPDGG
ncbi:MAG TPA: SigB/SigF/SigG family RNA polymerase sigma factor [Acidimicrobiia bacterium]|nr:SigB/SigF/SigG family RNA polymerase sigma factor [Acidimicrobiia bacterium]